MTIVMIGVANMSTVAGKSVSNSTIGIKEHGHGMNFHKYNHLFKFFNIKVSDVRRNK
jgi:hypothetical protein